MCIAFEEDVGASLQRVDIQRLHDLVQQKDSQRVDAYRSKTGSVAL